jgi:hypothetical protein
MACMVGSARGQPREPEINPHWREVMEIHPKWLPQCQVASHSPSHPYPRAPDVTTTEAKGIGEKRKPAHG